MNDALLGSLSTTMQSNACRKRILLYHKSHYAIQHAPSCH